MLFIIIFGTLSFRTGWDNLDNGLFTVEWLNQHGELQRNRYWARCTQYVTQYVQYRARQLREAMLLLMLRVVLPCVVGQRGPDSPSTSHQLSTISVDGLFSQVEAEHTSQHHDNAATDHANTTVNSKR